MYGGKGGRGGKREGECFRRRVRFVVHCERDVQEEEKEKKKKYWRRFKTQQSKGGGLKKEGGKEHVSVPSSSERLQSPRKGRKKQGGCRPSPRAREKGRKRERGGKTMPCGRSPGQPTFADPGGEKGKKKRSEALSRPRN